MSVAGEVTESGIVDTSRNANLVMASEENIDALLEIYEEQINSSESFPEYILSVEEQSQTITGELNNCSIENGVYAEALVLLNRLDNHQEYESDDMYKVWDTAAELVEQG